MAIAEFSLEFVRSKRELTADLSQLISQQPELAKKASGTVQSVDVVYPNEHDFPAPLYKMFCEELESRGLEVLPAAALRAASAYRRFQTSPPGTVLTLENAYDGSSDTGRIASIALRSVPELALLRGGGDEDAESIEADLLKELNVDVLLRVRVRVGTFSGHATLERGSVVRVCTSDLNGSLLANRSLVSDTWVIADMRERGGGWEVRVNLPRYEEALRRMFPPFIAMAFESVESAPKPRPPAGGGS